MFVPCVGPKTESCIDERVCQRAVMGDRKQKTYLLHALRQRARVKQLKYSCLHRL